MIVCGLGGLGLRIVEQLHHRDVPVVVVDDDRGHGRGAHVLESWGVPLVEADPTVQGGLNRYEIFPMIVAAARGN